MAAQDPQRLGLLFCSRTPLLPGDYSVLWLLLVAVVLYLQRGVLDIEVEHVTCKVL
jgi:hypothetical protein